MQFRLRGISAILAGLSFLAGLSNASEAQAQQPARRITRAISSEQRVALSGSLNPHVKSAVDSGRMDSSVKLTGISLFFKPSATQQQELEQLLAEQQDPSSANYHKWITPAEYAARFGMADADLQQVQSWLTSQGFTIDSVSPSKNRISFSGTVAQVEAAFGTEMHRYSLNGVAHFAPSTELSLPATLSGIVMGVRNLNDFRPKPHLVVKTNYTSASSGNHFLAPDDISTIYNVKSLYNRGYDGTGQRIAVVGQSAISLTDIANFRSAAGLAAKAPNLVLVPGTGSSVTASGDEGESDLDVEWTGGIAKNADIYFVYTGNNQNYGVFDALDYVIETNLAPVVSISYGSCEANFTASDKTTILSWFQQANAQGQTLIAAAGDSGSADCDYHAAAATKGLAVDVPASFAEVTGIGGTTFKEGSGSYWNSSNNTYGGSAQSYIPEKVWNDSVDYSASVSSLSSGGGGKSILFTKPSWQSAAGVPGDGARDVPDLSFAASASHDGYLYCSSDSSTGITGSCTNGFRDSANTYLTVAGGTSFGAPVFSGMLSVINQWKSPQGRGNINSSLYSLYNSTPAIFHDVTSGSNAVPCTGTKDCSSGYMAGYSAAAGYDLASGLGSVDVDALAAALPTITASSLAATTTTVVASTTTLTSGVAVTFTATVAPKSGSGVPSGTITWAVDGTTISPASLLTGGTATYSAAFTQSGSHVITATYSGDSSYAGSYGVVTATLGSTSSTGSSGTGSGASTATVTSKNSYAGTIKFSLSTSSNSLGGVCYTATSPTVSANSTATATITLYTNTSDCASGSVSHISGPGSTSSLNVISESKQPTKPTSRNYPMGIAIASLALIGGVGSRSRKWLMVVCVLVIGSFGLISGCGGGSSSSSSSSGSASFTLSATDITITKSSSSNVPSGTYAITIKGTDTSSSSLTASTTFNLTIK